MLGRLGNRSDSTARSFITKSIWRLRGALSRRYLINTSVHLSCSFRNFEKTVLAAYRWLSDNYQPGDCICLFGALEEYLIGTNLNAKKCLGFSRGAYQVRVLSAMIDKVQYLLSANSLK